MKHKITLTDNEIDSIRSSLDQVIAKGITMPELVRLDYKLEKLSQSKQRPKKAKNNNKPPDETNKNTEEPHDLPGDTLIKIVR